MNYPSYTYPVNSLYTGSSLGNLLAFARFDAESNLKGLWSSADNQYYAGEWKTEIIADGITCKSSDTIFTPESQTTLFAGTNVRVRKQCFVPFFTGEEAYLRAKDMQALLFLVQLTNESRSAGSDLVIRHIIHFPAQVSELFQKQPLPDQTNKNVTITWRGSFCEIITDGSPHEARVFGSSVPWSKCSGDEKSLTVEYRIHLDAGQELGIQWALTFSPNGIDDALGRFRRCGDENSLLGESITHYRRILSRSFIMTPEPVINRGLQWAKINTIRVQHNYRIGGGFTNDPPQDIIVVRDLAWYVIGSDYLTPQFSRNLLALAERFAYHDGGKLTEYFHANEEIPVQHDYDLNINDDTPLFVYALYHHAMTCEDDFGFRHVYPLMKRACDWILSQMREGLVWCDAAGTRERGICSWRNIIEGYTLSGAVTEINAECCYALKLTAEAGRHFGHSDESRFYADASQKLKAAINAKLLSEKTGLYLLNRSIDGVLHHDITGDLIFPAMFDVADEHMRERILKKLTGEEMWTRYGSRTVSKHEHNYDPDFGYQLVGGLWHNLMAWIAYCVRHQRPEMLIEGMVNIYRLCETQIPKDFVNVVPGEFPERLHGETYVSRGMAMSPWMPPTYLWLGIEGLLGARATFDGLELNPTLPENWNWVGVKGLLYKGNAIDAFLYEGTLYSTSQILTSYPGKIGTSIETGSDNDGIFHIGMKIDDNNLLFAASDHATTGTITANIRNHRYHQTIRLRAGEGVLLQVSQMTAGTLPQHAMGQK